MGGYANERRSETPEKEERQSCSYFAARYRMEPGRGESEEIVWREGQGTNTRGLTEKGIVHGRSAGTTFVCILFGAEHGATRNVEAKVLARTFALRGRWIERSERERRKDIVAHKRSYTANARPITRQREPRRAKRERRRRNVVTSRRDECNEDAVASRRHGASVEEWSARGTRRSHDRGVTEEKADAKGGAATSRNDAVERSVGEGQWRERKGGGEWKREAGATERKRGEREGQRKERQTG